MITMAFRSFTQRMSRNIVNKVKTWVYDRNLHTADPLKQHEKLKEEVQELLDALNADSKCETIDAIGDIQVVLICMCMQLGLNYDLCLEEAYDEIKDRKGRLIDGVFVKEADL